MEFFQKKYRAEIKSQIFTITNVSHIHNNLSGTQSLRNLAQLRLSIPIGRIRITSLHLYIHDWSFLKWSFHTPRHKRQSQESHQSDNAIFKAYLNYVKPI